MRQLVVVMRTSHLRLHLSLANHHDKLKHVEHLIDALLVSLIDLESVGK
jgi:hypothetical protein